MLCQKNVVVFLKLSVRGGKTHIAAAAVEPNDKGANGRTLIYRVFEFHPSRTLRGMRGMRDRKRWSLRVGRVILTLRERSSPLQTRERRKHTNATFRGSHYSKAQPPSGKWQTWLFSWCCCYGVGEGGNWVCVKLRDR